MVAGLTSSGGSVSVASGFFLGAMSLVSDYHVSRSNLDRVCVQLSEPSGSDFIIKYSNPKIDGETTYVPPK